MLRILLMTLLTITMVIPNSAHSGDIVIDDKQQRLELGSELSYLFDEQKIIDINQVIAEKSDLPWQKGTHSTEELLIPAGLYWIKGKMTNPYAHSISITLEVKPASIDIADLYLLYSNGDVITAYTSAGISDTFDNRPTLHRNLVNTFSIPANDSVTLIWRIEDSPRFQFNVVAWKPKYFFDKDQHIQLIHGMLYGIILVMVLYNLFLCISTKDKSYFYYVLYVASAGYLLAAEEGHIYYYIATSHTWPKYAVYTVLYSVNLFMFGQFCIYFLQLKKHAPRLKKIIRALSTWGAIIILITAVSSHFALVIASLLAIMLLYVTALVAGAIVRKQGIICAGYFVIAIMILVFSMTASTMADFGLIASSSLTQSMAAIGTTIMLTFFSLALADSINQLQKENREANIGINRANNEKLKAMAELNESQKERIKLEHQTNQAREESRSKSNFLANLSHEIRTPMNGVLGMTELIKSTSLNERQKYYLSTIENSGQTLLSIIDDLQNYAKIEAGEIESEFISFNLEALLDECISIFSLKSIEKNIDFIAELDPQIDPVLRGDVTKLKQIILNLVSNAFKFTESGSIILKVETTDRSAVNRVELKFMIQDSGIGLTEEEQLRLFSPFQHADKSTYGRYGGSGLGLAISKQLAELMDGQIGVTSTSGNGSCFWFTARLMIDTKPNISLLRERSNHLAGQHLLLVSSNSLTSNILKRLLTSWEINTDLVNNVEQALVQLQNSLSNNIPYTIILSEYQLSDGDVLSLANNAQLQSQSPPLIVMATRQQLSQEKALSNVGIKLFLEKPVTFSHLHSILKQAIMTPSEIAASPEAEKDKDSDLVKVLLVEDNPVNQMVLTGLLSALGIRPQIATDGIQAVEMTQSETFDLVLMDCEMPDMDGFEATRCIRDKEQQLQKPPVTIIALSAHATPQHQQQAKLAGMNNYLVKPVSVAKLRSVVESLNQ